MPEQIFPLVTSLKANTRGRAAFCKRESVGPELRGEEEDASNGAGSSSQIKNSQAWEGRRLLGEKPNGKDFSQLGSVTGSEFTACWAERGARACASSWLPLPALGGGRSNASPKAELW